MAPAGWAAGAGVVFLRLSGWTYDNVLVVVVRGDRKEAQMDEPADDDVAAINGLIARQFASLRWKAGGAPALDDFAADFLPGAMLFASARPVCAQSIGQFAERMNGLVGTTLKSFNEEVIGIRVHVFGNIAVAIAACENTENGTEVNRNVEMMLLVKDGGEWKIAAQAWDKATDTRPIPAELLASE
ncbi:MAG TPA: hypothetical protein VNZ50_11240 [Hyphomicrobiaceae bacterium]|nr:hypothetical protein [Hyphomicrobiaceae bacterium]